MKPFSGSVIGTLAQTLNVWYIYLHLPYKSTTWNPKAHQF